MAKLQQLKWIPMFIKAFQEARMRSDLAPPPQRKDNTQDLRDALPADKPKTPTVRKRNTGKSNFPRQSNNRKSKVVAVNNISNLQYQLMLRELRETKQRLNQLETIQQELARIHTMFDDHFGQATEPADVRAVLPEQEQMRERPPLTHEFLE